MTISKKSMKWIPWILILPVVIIRGFTTLYPILVTLKNSLFDIKILSGVNEFVGLSNYVNVFKDAKVITSVGLSILRYFKFNSCIWSISKKFTSKNDDGFITKSRYPY